MVKIWVTAHVGRPDTIQDVFEAARIARAADIARENVWIFEGPDPDCDVVDYCIDVPNETVSTVVHELLSNGIAPGAIDFIFTGINTADEAAAVEQAKAMATVTLQFETFTEEE